jgi:hypothetical protein
MMGLSYQSLAKSLPWEEGKNGVILTAMANSAFKMEHESIYRSGR